MENLTEKQTHTYLYGEDTKTLQSDQPKKEN